MVINKKAWHARLYRLALGVCARFTGNDYMAWAYEDRTNFCHYVRVCLVYLPLILVSHLLGIAVVLLTFVILPIELFGVGYGKAVLWIVGCFVVVAGMGAGAIFIANKISDWRAGKRMRRIPLTPGEQTTFQLVGAYIKAKKQGICPLIEFKEVENE